MKRIYSTTELTEAQMVRLSLEREGIPACIQNYLGSYHATFLPTPATEVDVLVKEEDVEDARPIVNDFVDDHFKENREDSIDTEEDVQYRKLKWIFVLVLWIGPLTFVAPIFGIDWETVIYWLIFTAFLAYVVCVNFNSPPGGSTSPNT